MDIVLCATQRCGSTLIIEDMRNTSVLGMPEEWFGPWNPEKTGMNWKDAYGWVQRQATGENGVSAVKIMANQLQPVDACLASFLEPLDDGVYPHFAAAFQDTKWVWLKRNDLVSQAISRIMSRQTGINHAVANKEDEHFAGNLARGYDPKYNDKTVYRYNVILREITSICLENIAWQNFFESHKIMPVELDYEDVIRDEEMKHLDLFAKLANIGERPERRKRSMVKMGNERNREWRNRFLKEAAENNFRLKSPEKESI